MRHRGPNRSVALNRWGLIALAAGLCISGLAILSTCRSDRITVTPEDPRSPKYAYRLDELALLQMAADDILNLERKKQYGTIYDEYTSRDFRKNVSRRRFLIMSNCVETYLGELQEFDSNDLSFNRHTLPGYKQPLDVLTRHVQRKRGFVDEQLSFISTGFNFKLNGLYWISKDKMFLQCIADSPKIEANTAPMPEAPPPPKPGETAVTPSGQKPSEPAATPDSGEAPATHSNEQHLEHATPSQPPPPAEPINPIPPRPAGAGGVLDYRPAPESETPPIPNGGDVNKQGNARGNRGTNPAEPAEHDATALH
ncbi:MAG TPA: hypothetical protein V6C99_06190 [Oculatellaceae cyanobacterium]